MIVFLVSLVSVSGFAAGLYLTGILHTARRITTEANTGIAAMLDSALSDAEKERAVRRAGIALISGSLALLWRIALCLAAAVLPVYLADLAGVAQAASIFALMLRFDYILGVSLALIALTWIFRRKAQPTKREDDSPSANNAADQFLHMLAFSGAGIQKLATGLENMIYAGCVARQPVRPPVLVTSMARGGTTAVLNALNALPQTVTLTYRDMPFVTAPLLWGRISAPFRREVARRKRAHGDGLSIDLDSPEAFDEVYWKLFWPEKYEKDYIALWTKADAKAKADEFFHALFAKLLVLRNVPTGRYLSKNNANIARLSLLPEMFEGCAVVIPLRQPAAHASSLLRQHENFLSQQSEDEFTRRYMRDIGHFEFGVLHKPVDFGGFDATAYDPLTPDYWLAYWIAAFREVKRHREGCYFLVQDDLRKAPVATMQALCHHLDLDVGDVDFAAFFRSEADISDKTVFDPTLLAEAEHLYEELALPSKGSV